ncbi:MAG: threonine/serine exporter ThrE family protein [Candidatus Cryptobacteroides sp.]
MENKIENPSSEEVLKLASEVGSLLLQNGAEISRVEETMERIASRYGITGENFFVLSNGIFTTGHSYANAEFIPIKGSRLDIVAKLNQFSRDIVEKEIPLPEARKRLDEIKNLPLKPMWEQYLGAGFGCAGFCAIFGGGFMDCAASFVAAIILNWFMVRIGSPYISKTLANIFGGLIGTLLCILFHHLGFGESLGNMIVGTLILLIPGVAFTNGLRDIANEDYLAGITRLMDALMKFLCIAIGVCFGFIVHSWFLGGVIQLTGAQTNPQTASIIAQMLAGFIGTAFFAILFGLPRKLYAPAGLVGMLGWMTFLVLFRYTPAGVFASTFVASTVVAVLSRFAAGKLKCPSTLFLICGEFPMIPGGGVFWTAYYIASEQFPMALNSGLQAIKVTIAIVLGIIIAANLISRRKAA